MQCRSLTLAGALAISAGAATLVAQTQINGAGGTFPNPVYRKWFGEYNTLHADVRIDYPSAGSSWRQR